MSSVSAPVNDYPKSVVSGRRALAPVILVTFLGSQAEASVRKNEIDMQALASLVKAQAQQIHDLQARLAVLEGHKPAIRKTHGVRGAQAVPPAAAIAVSQKTDTALADQTSQKALSPTVKSSKEVSSSTARSQSPTLQIASSDFATVPLSSAPPGKGGSIGQGGTRYPEQAAAPGSWGAVSAIPLNSSPVMGVDSSIPYAGRTTHVGGLVLKWGKGLPEFTTPDKQYAFRIRGRILFDYGSAFGSKFHDQNVSRTSLRAVRLGVEGRARQLSWVFEGDYSNNRVSVMSAYATWSDRMAKHLVEYTLGNKFNDRGFDGSTGSAETVFLDRDLVATSILPVRGWYGLGATFKIYGEGWHIATQITGNNVNSTNISNNLRDDLTYSFRAHWIPWRNKDALVHLGVWGFYEDVKPGANFSQNIRMLARTNDAFSARINTLPIANSMAGGLEAFGIWKTAWVLGEYGIRDIKFRHTYGAMDFDHRQGTVQAASVQTGIFLTGETPNYYALTGQWASPRVLDPVTMEELALGKSPVEQTGWMDGKCKAAREGGRLLQG